MKTLTAIYDLKQAPVTFDFISYLALTECYRQFYAYDRIDLTILADGYRAQSARERVMPEDEKAWRIVGILQQCVSICPTVKQLTVTDEKPDKEFELPRGYPNSATLYHPKYIIPSFQGGAKPRECFKSPLFARELVPKADVTLTIRSSRHFHKRNVNPADWITFHKYLRDKGYKVIVIPDQDDPYTYRHDWDGDVYIPAAFDMRLRLSAYESAKVNIGSNHGPFTTLFYTNAPYLMFDHMRGGVLSADLHKNSYGFEMGGQHAWSADNQIITWEDSTLQNLVRWFEESRGKFI